MKKLFELRISAVLFALALPLAVGSASCASARSIPTAPKPTTASLHGHVKLLGEAPVPKTWTLEPEMVAICGEQEISDESVLVSATGGLANCLVSAHAVDSDLTLPPLTNVLFEKVGPRYEPRLLVVPPGSEVVFRNRDSICKGFMARSATLQFNRTVVAGEEFVRKCERRGVVLIQCDLRPYMRGAVVVLDTPWHAITDKDGAWRIDDLPPGEYKLRVWHERMGLKPEGIATRTFSAGEEVTVDYNFKLP